MNEEKRNSNNNDLKRIHTLITVQIIIEIVVIACVLVFFSLGLHRCSVDTLEDPTVITYEETIETTGLTESSTEQTTESSTEPSTEPSTELPYEKEATTELSYTTTQTTTYEPTIYISTEPPYESPSIDERDVELLAMVIYQEVGSDAICDDCRRRVADVVLNRVESDLFPNTIEGVLTQSGQYGNYSRTGVCWPSRASYDSEAHAVERARRIAREVLEGNHSELYGNDYLFQAGFCQGSDGFWCCGVYYGKIY